MHQVQVSKADQRAMGPEYLAIVEVLKQYFDGLYRCDRALLAQVFHSRAQYFTASGGELLHLDMNTYLPKVEQRISPESSGEAYGFSIDSIELVGNVTAIASRRSSLFSKDYMDRSAQCSKRELNGSITACFKARMDDCASGFPQ